jgi:hypothetical protein
MESKPKFRSDVFLCDQDLVILTGRKNKRLQIEALKQMLVPFRVNALGHPVVTRAAIEGREQKAAPAEPKRWEPAVLKRKG